MNRMDSISRREFLARTGLAASGLGIAPFTRGLSAGAAERSSLPIVVFTKVYQELSLGFEDAAAVTVDAGLQGIDPTVRPGGEVLPERAGDDLPRYAEALRKRGLQLPFLTTAITSVSSAYTEAILRSAKALGVQFYRIGFIPRQDTGALPVQIREVKAQLRDLGALNRQLGIGAVFQNHSPSGHAYLGGDLTEMREIVSGFEPNQIGVAFDIGHALVVHGEGWRAHFEALKSHLKVAYVKDVNAQGQWVPFGEGRIHQTDYFQQLKQLGYQAPLCIHMEYDWSEHGKSKNRPTLVNALKQSAAVVRSWVA
jgi:sugar phosphate isomerase/epimerase